MHISLRSFTESQITKKETSSSSSSSSNDITKGILSRTRGMGVYMQLREGRKEGRGEEEGGGIHTGDCLTPAILSVSCSEDNH